MPGRFNPSSPSPTTKPAPRSRPAALGRQQAHTATSSALDERPHAQAIRASEKAYTGGGAGLPALVDGQIIAPGALPDRDQVGAAAPAAPLVQW